MLYLKSSDDKLKIVILESDNLDEIRKGRPAKTPDGAVLIAWTPDPLWLTEKLIATDGDAATIGRLIDEASQRPEAGPRPNHETIHHKFEG